MIRLRLLCFCVPGFYYTSLGKTRNPAGPASSPSSSSSSSSSVLRDAKDRIISRGDGSFSRRPARVPLEPRLCHHLSVVTKLQDCLNVVGVDVQRSPSRRDVPWHVANDQSSSAKVLSAPDVHRPARRRRRADVLETSFIEPPPPSSSSSSVVVQRNDVAIQVSLPQRRVASSSPRLPLTGRLVPASQRKSSINDNFDQSTNMLTMESGLGGSMPCLISPDEMAPDRHCDFDVLVINELSTSASLSPSRPTGSTLTSVQSAVKTRSYHHLNCDDEGYLTKESNTSNSSVDTSRHSPVFF